MKKIKDLIAFTALTLVLLVCTALPSFASEVSATMGNAVNTEMFEPLYEEPAQVPSELELVERLVKWTPQFIVDIVAVWANYLIIAASVFMLILRLLGWFLPSSFNRLLAPLAKWFRWLTKLLDIIALNSNENTGGPHKNRRGG